ETLFDVRHNGLDLAFREMLDCGVPDDVVEGPVWHLGSNVGNLVGDVGSLEVPASVVDGFWVKINAQHGAGANAVEMMGIEAIATAQFEDAAVRIHGQQRKRATFHEMRAPCCAPRPEQTDLVLEKFWQRENAPLNETKAMIGGRSPSLGNASFNRK